MEKKIKIIILLLVVLVVAGVATHIFLTPSTVETAGSKNVTDMIGRNIEIPASVGNIPITVFTYTDASGHPGVSYFVKNEE